LLKECIDGLNIKADGIYIDGTAGGGGHSAAIAQRLKNGRLIAIDKDGAAIEAAGEKLASYPAAKVVRGDFRDMPDILDGLGIPAADGVLLDLGVSSHQLDETSRGFSYRNEAPLDMRMGCEGPTARDVVNNYDTHDLARILREYGEERFACRIARAIAAKRMDRPIETTTELSEIITTAIPAATRREGGHPAKRSFQAIRIEVNGELESLTACIEGMFARLNPAGRFAVITFHSLEDRLVKRQFAAWCKGCECPPHFPVCICGKQPKAAPVTKKPITPSPGELEANNRSRSAKLRIIEKL